MTEREKRTEPIDNSDFVETDFGETVLLSKSFGVVDGKIATDFCETFLSILLLWFPDPIVSSRLLRLSMEVFIVAVSFVSLCCDSETQLKL